MAKILVADDELSMRQFLEILLKKEGHEVVCAGDGQEAFSRFQSDPVDLVISDIKMPRIDGLELLRRVKEQRSSLPVIMVTAYASPEDAIAAMKAGAYDYLTKPFKLEEIKSVIRNALEQTKEQAVAEAPVGIFCSLVGHSSKMVQIYNLIRQVGPTKTNVLISGESGTGKELVARAIHYSGDRAEKPFVTVSCAALTETLLESELFGHEKGSFTGAAGQTKGKFELADGGTIFLDEIGDISPKLQADLLRVLQERRFYRVGGTEEVSVDVRVIAATNKNLPEEVQQGRFRDDLYYRLNVIEINLPALRERREDIPLLAEHFVEKIASELGKDISGISADALKVLIGYDWPGNVRELENVIERAMVTSHSDTLEVDDFTWLTQRTAPQQQNWDVPDVPLGELERRAIIAVLERKKGNVKEAAASLGIDRSTLYDKLKRYEIVH